MFSFRRMRAVAVKELIHIVRDWRSLFLAMAIPVMLIILFGYALNMDLKNIPTGVIDMSRTPESRALVSFLDGSDYFQVQAYFEDYDTLYKQMREIKILTAIIIKRDFAVKLNKNEKTSVQLIVDGSDANTGRLALNYAQGLGLIYNQNILAERAEISGVQGGVPSVNAIPRSWYNQGLVSTYSVVPGIIAIVMVVIAAMLASVTVAREWETGTMEQLISTPVRKLEFTIGKVTPLFAVGLFDVAIAAFLGRYLFEVPLRGEPGLIFFTASIFLLGSLFYGLMLSIAFKTQMLANQTALLSSYLPAMILSGFVFTIDNMPWLIQKLTYIVPARYFIAMLKSIFLKGVGLEMMVFNFSMLFLYMVIMIFLANKRLKMRLD